MKAAIHNPWTFITLCLALPVTAYSVMTWYNLMYEKTPVIAQVHHQTVQGFVDQQNKPVSNLLPGKITVINFFFTSCPVVCVKMMKNMKRVNEAYAANADVRFISISVDPDHDTPDKMRHYISRLKIDDRKWQLVTGSKQQTYASARNEFSLVAAEANVDTDFIHSDKLILVDEAGNIRGYYNGMNTSEIDKLINDIKNVNNEPPNLFAK